MKVVTFGKKLFLSKARGSNIYASNLPSMARLFYDVEEAERYIKKIRLKDKDYFKIEDIEDFAKERNENDKK